MKEEWDTPKSLREDKSIIILLADKSHASIVLNTDTYHTRMSALIETVLYQLLTEDPTDHLTQKLAEKLLSLKWNGHITEAVYNKIRLQHKQPPRIYVLPKIHKANIPLRPVVSYVNNFAYDLVFLLSEHLNTLNR